MTTGLVFHETYLWHDTGHGWIIPNDGVIVQPLEHPENPETKRRVINLWRAAGVLDQLTSIEAPLASDDDLRLVHTARHIDQLRAISAAGGGDAGGLTPIGLGSFDIARRAAGGCIAAADAVLDGVVENAYAFVRPPGHHALGDAALGFCMFNNAAIAVQHLRRRRGLTRVAMVDWDVHHGNGQQSIFYDDPDVLTISIHQDLCFPPDSGYLADTGSGAGDGFNINVPLPPGSGHGAYLDAFARVVVPAVRAFAPEFIVVPSGFDGGFFDPLGRMMAWSETFRSMTATVKALAHELCGGRLLLTHEGGYSAAYVPFIGLAVVEELSGVLSGVRDPYFDICEHAGHQELQPHQQALISDVVRHARLLERTTA